MVLEDIFLSTVLVFRLLDSSYSVRAILLVKASNGSSVPKYYPTRHNTCAARAAWNLPRRLVQRQAAQGNQA